MVSEGFALKDRILDTIILIRVIAIHFLLYNLEITNFHRRLGAS